MSLLVHFSLWPWNRTTARSAVAARTGGIEDLWPWGMSTATYGRLLRRRNSSVSSVLSSPSNQDSCRNSTATRSGLHRLATSCTYCLLERRMVNQGGNWNRIAPSLSASVSGPSADRNLSHTASIAAGSRSDGYTLRFSVSGRRSL